MANILSVEKLTKTVGDKTLFSNISFGLDAGEKIGLIGVNGCGKSTLLRLLAGFDEPDSGRIVTSRGLGISYLSQLPAYEPEHSIREHLFEQGSFVLRLIRRYREICERLAQAQKPPAVSGGGGEAAGGASISSASLSRKDNPEGLQSELDAVLEEIERADAFGWEKAIASILRELGLSDLDQPMRELSGGKLKKVALAQALIHPGELLLLDEPTNHLDIDTILWLQRYLEKMPRSLILITHDRYFLDEVVKRTFEIAEKTLYKYEGSYHYFLEKKAERLLLAERIRAKQERFLKKELEWLKRQPKARGTKQKARLDRFTKIASMQKAPSKAELSFTVSGRRLGKRILEVKKIRKAYGDKILFNDFSWFFKQGERIGIVGPNGSGKSTFLNVLTGRQSPDSGSVNPGVHTKFGYFDQAGRLLGLSEEDRVLKWIKREVGEWISMADGSKVTASEMLELFSFTPQMQSAPIRSLSGGERRRLQLVAVLLGNPNFLLLDEPTNDLDVNTLSRLEAFLQNYDGCLLIVSHDRYFMDRVVDELFVFDGKGGLEAFPSNFSDYLDYKKFKESQKRKSDQDGRPKGFRNKAKQQKKAAKPTRAGFKEKKEFSELEVRIERDESRKAEIEGLLANGGLGHTELREFSSELSGLVESLESAYERWAELAELIEKG